LLLAAVVVSVFLRLASGLIRGGVLCRGLLSALRRRGRRPGSSDHRAIVLRQIQRALLAAAGDAGGNEQRKASQAGPDERTALAAEMRRRPSHTYIGLWCCSA